MLWKDLITFSQKFSGVSKYERNSYLPTIAFYKVTLCAQSQLMIWKSHQSYLHVNKIWCQWGGNFIRDRERQIFCTKYPSTFQWHQTIFSSELDSPVRCVWHVPEYWNSTANLSQVTVAYCECTFSKLKLIRNYFRSVQNPGHTSKLGIVSIEEK
jgi:hypothetical protein